MANTSGSTISTIPTLTSTNYKEITKEEYDAIKNKELADSNLDVYDTVETQDDADDIILSMDTEYVDEDVMTDQDTDEIAYNYDPNKNYVYKSNDGSLYTNKDAPIASTTTKSSSPESKTGPSYSGSGVPTSCSDITANFSKNLKISKHYTLGDVAVYFDRLVDKTAKVKRNGAKVDQKFTKYQLACNLKALAVNILDKIKDQFPDMEINSTIRNLGSGSEHETGQAADLRFTKHKKKDYIIIINWIYSNCPYTQLFLEYRPSENPKGGWIHVSYTQPGNLVYGATKTASTLYNDKSDAPGAAGRFVNVMSKSDWV